VGCPPEGSVCPDGDGFARATKSAIFSGMGFAGGHPASMSSYRPEARGTPGSVPLSPSTAGPSWSGTVFAAGSGRSAGATSFPPSEPAVGRETCWFAPAPRPTKWTSPLSDGNCWVSRRHYAPSRRPRPDPVLPAGHIALHTALLPVHAVVLLLRPHGSGALRLLPGCVAVSSAFCSMPPLRRRGL